MKAPYFSLMETTEIPALKARAICILGMHRSGTSAVTRAVNLLGAHLGDNTDLMLAGPDNPEGFWERNDIVALHDHILESFKLNWDTSLPLPTGWEGSEEVGPFREQARNIIVNMNQHGLWAWKDPRTCLFLPMWKKLLCDLGTELSTIFVSRNPLDVAHSLARRNGFSLNKAYGIWFNYTLTALQSLSDVPTVFLSYDSLFDLGETELKRCAEVIGLSWPKEGSIAVQQLQTLLKPSLRHSFSNEVDLHNAPRPVQELYALTCDLVKQGAVYSVPQDLLAPLAASFSQYSLFFRFDFEQLTERDREKSASATAETEAIQAQLEKRTAWCKQLEKDLRKNEEQLKNLQAEFAERTTWALQLKTESEKRGILISELQKTLDERSAWALKSDQALNECTLRLATVQKEFDERGKWALQLQDDLYSRAAEILEKRKTIESQSNHISSLEAMVLKLTGQLVHERESRATEIKQLDETLAKMVRSKSWRITAPLRAIASFLTKKYKQDGKRDR